MRVYEGGVGPLADSIIETVVASGGFVLEIGCLHGEGSTSMIQEGLENHPNPLHISVDWSDELYAPYRPEVPWWHFVLGDSRKISTFEKVSAIAGPRFADVIFIDTDHNYEQMRLELGLWGTMAAPDCTWLGHDSWMYGPENVEMNRAIKEYAAEYNWVYDDYRKDSHGLWRMRRPQNAGA